MLLWHAHFIRGARSKATDSTIRVQAAVEIARCMTWSDQTVEILAKHFVYLACEQQKEVTHEGLAPFAMEVRNHFASRHSPVFANSFVRFTREWMFKVFRTFWSVVRDDFILNSDVSDSIGLWPRSLKKPSA
jgi:hypothetical protein